jgi:hypothetical protein
LRWCSSRGWFKRSRQVQGRIKSSNEGVVGGLGITLRGDLVLIELVQEGLSHKLPGIAIVVVGEYPAFLWEGIAIGGGTTTLWGKVDTQRNVSTGVGVELP